jgi:hypothetical protein
MRLDVVGCDGGSTDAGPSYLGTGAPLVAWEAVSRDLEWLWEVARSNQAPLVIGTCGGSGTDDQLLRMLEMTERIARRRGWSARTALIHSELQQETVLEAVRQGRIESLDGVPALDSETVRETERIVAMMGIEPLVAALEGGANVVLAGRCSDAAIFAALPILRGVDPGIAWHAGKLLECGASCADPPGSDCLVAEIENDELRVYAPNPSRRCTRESVLAFMLHEAADPFRHRESNGILDLTAVKAHENGAGTVTLTGATFHVADEFTVKLEGAAKAGYRTVLIGATRDPRLINQIMPYLDRVLELCRTRASQAGICEESYDIHISPYGVNGVLGPLEQENLASHEVAVAIDIIGDTPTVSKAIASTYRSLLLHSHFDGRQCTEGNFAFPFSPSELDGGQTHRFSVWHSMAIDDPLNIFPIELHDVG